MARADRATGMAASQADVAHKGVAYDIEVDTSRTQSLDCARLIAARVSLDVAWSACRRDYGHGTVDTLMA